MEKHSKNDDLIICQTANWIESVVVACNFCPFARRVLENGNIHYQVTRETNLQACLEALLLTLVQLNKTPSIETSLIIYPQAFTRFDDYLEMLEIAENVLIDQGYEGTYQLASFHPEYRFADTPVDDPANYTNRSPHPMLHLLREYSIEQALQTYPDPEHIPERNVDYARAQGLEKMRSRLDACLACKK